MTGGPVTEPLAGVLTGRGRVPVMFETPRSPDVHARLGALATSRAPRLRLTARTAARPRRRFSVRPSSKWSVRSSTTVDSHF